MNQKYLMGMAAEGGQSVVFEATAPNVAAFISQNRIAPELLICTLDYKMFLTARRGMVDACPDRKFLVQELLPVLVPMQTGQVQDIPLVIVPREGVQDEECPQPDWNYLRWAGYDNEKFEKIMDGSALINYEFLGETIPMELRIGQYVERGGLAIELVSWEEKEPEDWDTITVNLSVPCEKDHAFVDINNLGMPEICEWIEENGLGKATGRQQSSGFCTYPEYHFDAKRLKELDREGYEKYAAGLQHRGRAAKSNSRPVR
jgi:hypothetical protein